MGILRTVLVALVSVIFFTHPLCAEKPEPNLASGRFTYARSCARCHGVTGAGDGPDALHLLPRPRNLVLGTYKLRTTESGTPPTDADLFRSITQGLHGTSMPAWENLTEEDRWQLVYYLQSLSTIFEEVDPEPITLAKPPKHFDHAKGQETFANLGCIQCHGVQGRGNGPSAAGLVDDNGDPLPAANLTQGWNYRGGATTEDIVWRMLTGLDGTPMPSYSGAAADTDVWHMSSYVRTLQEEPQWSRAVTATRVTTAPHAITDPQWNLATPTDIRLTSRVFTAGVAQPTSVNAARVQALYTASHVAIRLQWHDRSESRTPHPDMVALVMRSPDIRGDIVTLQNWPLEDAPTLDVHIWSASKPGVREYVGYDYQPILSASTLPTHAIYDDGVWSLQFVRPLHIGTMHGSVALEDGTAARFALAAWDGDNNETGRLHASSSWFDLILGTIEEVQHASQH